MRMLLGLLVFLSSAATPLALNGRLLAVSPDGRRLALEDAGSVFIYDGDERLVGLPLILSDSNPRITVTFSADAGVVAVSETPGNSARWASTVYDIDRDELLYLGPDAQVVLSPDGSAYAVYTTDGTTTLYDATTGDERARWEWTLPWSPPAFTPDGARLVVSLPGEPSVRLVDATTGDDVRRFDGHMALMSPDGTRLLLRDENDLTWGVFDLTTLQTIVSGSILDHDVDLWTADSRYVYGQNYWHTVMLDAATGDVAFYTETDGNVSPDGTAAVAIARSDDGSPSRLTLVDVATGEAGFEATFNGINTYFSADSRYLILPQYSEGDLPQRTDVIDVAAGEVLYTLPFFVDRVSFDGGWMAVEAEGFTGLIAAPTGEMLAAGNGVVLHDGDAYVSYGRMVDRFAPGDAPLRPIAYFENGAVTEIVNHPAISPETVTDTLYGVRYCGVVDRYSEDWLWLACPSGNGWTQEAPTELLCPRGDCDVYAAPPWQQ